MRSARGIDTSVQVIGFFSSHRGVLASLSFKIIGSFSAPIDSHRPSSVRCFIVSDVALSCSPRACAALVTSHPSLREIGAKPMLQSRSSVSSHQVYSPLFLYEIIGSFSTPIDSHRPSSARCSIVSDVALSCSPRACAALVTSRPSLREIGAKPILQSTSSVSSHQVYSPLFLYEIIGSFSTPIDSHRPSSARCSIVSDVALSCSPRACAALVTSRPSLREIGAKPILQSTSSVSSHRGVLASLSFEIGSYSTPIDLHWPSSARGCFIVSDVLESLVSSRRSSSRSPLSSRPIPSRRLVISSPRHASSSRQSSSRLVISS
jgi:hypothetical protein